jgi:hypothetical protein
MANQAENPYSYYATKDLSRGPEPSLQFLEAYQFVFANPNWMMNLLLLCVALMIPVIGALIMLGYFMVVVHALHFRTTPTYPDFDFNRFSEYLTRGLWPFVVALVASFVLLPVMLAGYCVPLLLGVLFASIDQTAGMVVFILSQIVAFVLGMAFSILWNLMMSYCMLRAAWTEDIAEGLNFSAAWDFATKMWLEYLLETFFLLVTAPFIVLAGLAACCVGYLPALSLVMFAQMHFLAQLYAIYLARGGIAISVKNPPSVGPRPGYPSSLPIGPPSTQFPSPTNLPGMGPPGGSGNPPSNPYRP